MWRLCLLMGVLRGAVVLQLNYFTLVCTFHPDSHLTYISLCLDPDALHYDVHYVARPDRIPYSLSAVSP